MAKSKVVFFCKDCGHEVAKWVGKCPGCQSWNTMVEELKTDKKAPKIAQSAFANQMLTPKKITEIETIEEDRLKTSISELNRALGGGIVNGSLVLFGGEPGIGKSTLLLQTAND